MVHRSPHIAKAVQHVPEQGREVETVQPAITKPSVGSEGDIGVIILLSKKRRNESTFHSSDRDNKQNSA
jgi:hypothetical protein